MFDGETTNNFVIKYSETVTANIYMENFVAKSCCSKIIYFQSVNKHIVFLVKIHCPG